MAEETEREGMEKQIEQGENIQDQVKEVQSDSQFEAQSEVQVEEQGAAQREVQSEPQSQQNSQRSLSELKPVSVQPDPQPVSAPPTPPISPQYSLAPLYGAYDSSARAEETPTVPEQEPVSQANSPSNAGFEQNEAHNDTHSERTQRQHPFSSNSSLPQFPFGEEFRRSNALFSNGRSSSDRAKASKASIILTAFIAAIITAALCLGIGYIAIERGWLTPVATVPINSLQSNNPSPGSAKVLTTNSVDWTDVAKTVSPSVVSIQVKTRNAEFAGSGVIVDAQGHIVTNNHVVAGGRQILVTLANGQIYNAKIVGTDPTTDLAVIALVNAPKDLTVAHFANSDQLAVGEPVLAIGNPLGYDDSVTSGIISALNRPVSVMDRSRRQQVVTNAIQIDAAINPGNSGGPTFNAAGQVVGINSSIASRSASERTAGSIGIGFAIPANLVARVMKDIIANGHVDHVMLGVVIRSVTVDVDGVTRAGAQIVDNSASSDPAVVSGSPAAKAGLKAGDIIIGFDGKPVGNNFSLLGYVRAAALNQTVVLTVVRDKRVIKVKVTLDQKEKSRQRLREDSDRRDRDQQDDQDRDNRDNPDDRNRDDNGRSNKDRGNNRRRDRNPSPWGDQGNNDEDPDNQFFDPFGLW